MGTTGCHYRAGRTSRHQTRTRREADLASGSTQSGARRTHACIRGHAAENAGTQRRRATPDVEASPARIGRGKALERRAAGAPVRASPTLEGPAMPAPSCHHCTYPRHEVTKHIGSPDRQDTVNKRGGRCGTESKLPDNVLWPLSINSVRWWAGGGDQPSSLKLPRRTISC